MIKHQHCYFLQGAIRKGGEGVGNVGFEKKDLVVRGTLGFLIENNTFEVKKS